MCPGCETGGIKMTQEQSKKRDEVLAAKMAEKLRECPFCGGKATLDKGVEQYQVWCEHCWTVQMGVFYDTEAEAIAAWNRRVSTEKKEGDGE